MTAIFIVASCSYSTHEYARACLLCLGVCERVANFVSVVAGNVWRACISMDLEFTAEGKSTQLLIVFPTRNPG